MSNFSSDDPLFSGTEMQLYDNFYDAKKAVESAIAVMDDPEKSQIQRLRAFAAAMRAEQSLIVLAGDADPQNDWLIRKYHAAVKFGQVFSRCNAEATAIAEKARRAAYAQAMAERFHSQLHPELREEMDVELTDDGWEFTASY